jgi:hypothetical protein
MSYSVCQRLRIGLQPIYHQRLMRNFRHLNRKGGVGDSQALILILTEFLDVSQEVSRASSLDVEALKGELRSELLSELDFRFSELKGELLSKPLNSVEIDRQQSKAVEPAPKFIAGAAAPLDLRLTIAQLSEHFGCDPSLMRKQKSKYKDEPEKFIAWSKSRDPEGRGWKFDEKAKIFAPADG